MTLARTGYSLAGYKQYLDLTYSNDHQGDQQSKLLRAPRTWGGSLLSELHQLAYGSPGITIRHLPAVRIPRNDSAHGVMLEKHSPPHTAGTARHAAQRFFVLVLPLRAGNVFVIAIRKIIATIEKVIAGGP